MEIQITEPFALKYTRFDFNYSNLEQISQVGVKKLDLFSSNKSSSTKCKLKEMESRARSFASP